MSGSIKSDAARAHAPLERSRSQVSATEAKSPEVSLTTGQPVAAYTVGSYLAARLAQIGLKHHFAVAGDYKLVLLNELLTNKDMKQVYCSNELNCGFSAEGYARANGAPGRANADRMRHRS